MSVAKPKMLASPAPLTPQTLCGVPASWFSVTIALAGTIRFSRSSSARRV
jgi:hypothetical protein